MSPNLTVVICCAGTGSRLGLGMTKALVEIRGKPLISWQLALLRDVADVRIVVGHDAHRVIETVLPIRRDVLFVMNRDYAVTGTAASLALAIHGTHHDAEIISLDGDLLVRPTDLERFLLTSGPRLGLVKPVSSEPVLVDVDTSQQLVARFSRSRNGVASSGCLEWSGLCRIPATALRVAIEQERHRGHVFEMLRSELPMPFDLIEAQEIDTMDDFERAAAWLENRFHEWNDLW